MLDIKPSLPLPLQIYVIYSAGVKGIIRDLSGAPIAGAKVDIIGRNHGTNSTKHGEFWRLLLPGTYHLKVSIDSDYNILI